MRFDVVPAGEGSFTTWGGTFCSSCRSRLFTTGGAAFTVQFLQEVESFYIFIKSKFNDSIPAQHVKLCILRHKTSVSIIFSSINSTSKSCTSQSSIWVSSTLSLVSFFNQVSPLACPKPSLTDPKKPTSCSFFVRYFQIFAPNSKIS